MGGLINLSALVSASVCCTQQPPTHSTHTETQTHTHVVHIYTVLVTHFHPDLLSSSSAFRWFHHPAGTTQNNISISICTCF